MVFTSKMCEKHLWKSDISSIDAGRVNLATNYIIFFCTKSLQNSEKYSEQISLKTEKVIGSSKNGDNFNYDAKLDLEDLVNNGKSSTK